MITARDAEVGRHDLPSPLTARCVGNSHIGVERRYIALRPDALFCLPYTCPHRAATARLDEPIWNNHPADPSSARQKPFQTLTNTSHFVIL